MKMSSQVVHVMAKDVRQSIVPIAAYVGMMGLSTVKSGRIWNSNYQFLFDAAVVLTALVLTITLVQNDSPTQADAYWRTIPVRGKTVWAAKCLLLLVLILSVGVVAQVLSILIHDAPLQIGLVSLSQSLVIAVGQIVLGSIIAAVTPGITTSIVTYIAFYAVGIIGWSVPAVSKFFDKLSRTPVAWWTEFLMLAGMTAALYLLFANRWSANRARAFALVAVLSLMALRPATQVIALALPKPVATVAPRRANSPPRMTATLSDNQIVVKFAIPSADSLGRFVIVNPTALIKLPNALSVNLTNVNGGSSFKEQIMGVTTSRNEISRVHYSDLADEAAPKAPRDSLYVVLRFRAPDTLNVKELWSGATVEFDCALELQLRQETFEAPFRAGRFLQGAARLNFEVPVPVNSGADFIFEATAFGRQNNPANQFAYYGGTQMAITSIGITSSPSDYVLPKSGGPSTYMLIRHSPTDTLILVPGQQHAGTVPLPVPFTTIDHASIEFRVDTLRTGVALRSWIGNSRFVASNWFYASHTPLHANLRVQKP